MHYNALLPDEFASSEPSALIYNGKGVSPATMTVETCSRPTGASTDVPGKCATSGVLNQPENGTTMKSIKQMLADSSLFRRGHRRKVAAKPQRGLAAYDKFSIRSSSLKKGDHCFPKSVNDGSVVAIPLESCELSTDSSIIPIGHATSSILKKPENGVTMKSTDHVPVESLADTRRGRGRKVAAKYRSGRRGKRLKYFTPCTLACVEGSCP